MNSIHSGLPRVWPQTSLSTLTPRQQSDDPSPAATDKLEPHSPARGLKKEEEEGSLTQEERVQVAKLVAVDARIRAHEAAHLAAAGGIAVSGASFSTVQGPDGRMYAVAGEVSIDMSGGSTPEETITRMQQVRAAALAPSDPSPQDMRVASTAMMLEMRARVQLALEERVEAREGDGKSGELAHDDLLVQDDPVEESPQSDAIKAETDKGETADKGQ